jgi:cytoskeletal protein RodZ
MKAKEFMRKFLSNKYVLMGVTVLAVLNLIGYMALNNFESVIYFILIGSITFFFSKNMIIVLGVPLILVNLLRIKSKSKSREGMENNANANKDTNKDTNAKNTSKDTLTNTNKNTNQNQNSSNPTSGKQFKEVLQKAHSQKASSQQGLPITPLPTTDVAPINTDTSDATVDESFEVGRSKKNSSGYNIDYASTIEDAYDQLNSILGSDGIKQLTNDTQGLMKQQMQLAESMKEMGPMIAGMAPLMTQAKGLLRGFGGLGEKKEKR